jgi:DNA repair exonuclease SbcCD ATPase subunit
MPEDARGEVPEEMDGLSTDEAVELILERDDTLDPDDVRERLEYVTREGVVCREGIEDGLGDVSQIIATPENRIDIARREFETAADLAEPVADLAIVAARLEEFEERLLGLKEEIDRLGPELNELFNDWLEEHDDVYAMADGLHQHATRGQRMHQMVDELIVDLESFQEWVQDEETRFDELRQDVEGVDESLANLEGALADLEESDPEAKRETDADSEPGAEAGEREREGDEPEPALIWVDAALRHRLVGLLVADLETELDGLRTWTKREGSASTDLDDLAERIETVRDRWEAIDGRIDAAARPAWRERFDDQLAAFENDLDAFDPPVDWAEVQRTLEEHQAEIVSGAGAGQ